MDVDKMKEEDEKWAKPPDVMGVERGLKLRPRASPMARMLKVVQASKK
jgi:hypothetical protein